MLLLQDRSRVARALLFSLILFLSLVATARSGEWGDGRQVEEEEEVEEEEGRYSLPTCLSLPHCQKSSAKCNFEVESRIPSHSYHFYGPEITGISTSNLQCYTCYQTTVPTWEQCEGSMSFGVQKVTLPADDYEEEEQVLEGNVKQWFVVADWIVANVCLNALDQVVAEDCVTQVGIVELIKQDRALFIYLKHQSQYKKFEYTQDWRLRDSNLNHVINPGAEDQAQLSPLPGLPFVNVKTAHALFNTSTAGSPGRMTLLAHNPEYLKLHCNFPESGAWKLSKAEFVLEKYVMIVPISNCQHPHAITGEVIKLLSFTELVVDCSRGSPHVITSKTVHTNETVSDEEKGKYQNILSEMASNGWSEYIRTPLNDNPHTMYWVNTTVCTLNPFPAGGDLPHYPPCSETRIDEEEEQVRDEL